MARSPPQAQVLDSLGVTVFRAYSYACILDGFDRLPALEHTVLQHVGYEAGFRELERMRTDGREILAQLPEHRHMLLALYGDARPAA